MEMDGKGRKKEGTRHKEGPSTKYQVSRKKREGTRNYFLVPFI